MLKRTISHSLMCMLLGCASMQALAQVPTVTGVSPVSASFGETVSISGSNFAGQANLQVRFGSQAAPILSATASGIRVSLPAGATHAPLTVTNLSSGLSAAAAQMFVPSFGGQGIAAENFIAQSPLAGKTGIKQLAVSDFNNDGKTDIAYSASGSSVAGVYQNSSAPAGALAFSALNINLGVPSRGITAADLNGDGRPELIYTGFDATGNLLFVLRNTSSTSSISFASPLLLTAPANGATRLEVRDLNADGKPEIVVSDETKPQVYIFVNQSSGSGISFQSTPLILKLPGANAYALQLQDLNGDHKPEIITANYMVGNVHYLRNESTASGISFGAAQTILKGITSVVEVKVGDLNADGKADIALTDHYANQLVIGLNESSVENIQFSALHKINLQNAAAWDLEVADLDGDGKLDLAVNHQTLAKITLLRNMGFSNTPAFEAVSLTGTGKSTALKIADFNGDARPDILYTNLQDNSLGIFLNVTCPTASIKQQCSPNGVVLMAPKLPTAIYSWQHNGVALASTGSSLNISETGEYSLSISFGSCSFSAQPLQVSAIDGFPGNPSFSAIEPICEGEDLVLSIASPVDGASYTWQNTNGFSASTSTPTLTIPNANTSHAGYYTVHVKVGDCEISLNSPEPASVAAPPNPVISPSKTGSICAGEAVTLSVASAYVSYQWKKDGQPLAGKTSFAINVTEPGSYTVSVGVKGNCTGESAAFKFEPLENPTAGFEAPALACLNQTVSFKNNSTAVSGQPLYYLWDFGDGTTSTEQHPKHAFSGAAGDMYTVSLQVGYGSSKLCAQTFTKTITVATTDDVRLEASALEFCAGEAVEVRVLGDVQEVQWSDGQKGSSISTKQGGTLQANIITAGGCTLTKAIALQRNPLPELSLSADRMLINPGESVVLTAIGGTNYQWSPAESLDDAASATPTASPKTTTTYTLSSLSASGCMATAEITIEVSNQFSVEIPKIFIPQTDGQWVIKRMEEYPNTSLQLVNSLGHAVLEAAPYQNNWDGSHRGSPLPAGVYYYVIKDQQQNIVRTGSLTLLR